MVLKSEEEIRAGILEWEKSLAHWKEEEKEWATTSTRTGKIIASSKIETLKWVLGEGEDI